LQTLTTKPPTESKQVSAELHLKTHARYKQVTFASGLHFEPPSPSDASSSSSTKAPRVLISYGSGDATGRVLVLSVEEVERLFLVGPTGQR